MERCWHSGEGSAKQLWGAVQTNLSNKSCRDHRMPRDMGFWLWAAFSSIPMLGKWPEATKAEMAPVWADYETPKPQHPPAFWTFKNLGTVTSISSYHNGLEKHHILPGLKSLTELYLVCLDNTFKPVVIFLPVRHFFSKASPGSLCLRNVSPEVLILSTAVIRTFSLCIPQMSLKTCVFPMLSFPCFFWNH